MTKFDMVAEKSFGEDLEPFGTIDAMEKSPELKVVPSFSHILRGMKSLHWSPVLLCKEEDWFHELRNSENNKDTAYLPSGEEESMEESGNEFLMKLHRAS